MTAVTCIVALAIVMFLATFLYGKFWCKGLEVDVRFEGSNLEEGDSSFLAETVSNKKRLPMPILLVKFRLDKSIDYLVTGNHKKTDKQYRSDCIEVMPYQKVTRKYEVVFTKRGYFEISDVELIATDLFYNNIYSGKLTTDSSVYVYPGHTKLQGVEYLQNRISGECITRQFLDEDPFEFKGIRDYQPTDSMRRINWNATAKTGMLKVSQYHSTTNSRVTIFLNVETEGMLFYEDLIEEGIRIARTLMEHFCRLQIRTRLITNSADVHTGEAVTLEEGIGEQHFTEALYMMARMTTEKSVIESEKMLEPFVYKGGEPHFYLLISVCQTPELIAAFENCIGEMDYGEVIIPVTRSMEKRVQSDKVRVTYADLG